MPTRAAIVAFDDARAGRSESMGVWRMPAGEIELSAPDPQWRSWYDHLAGRIRRAVGWRVLDVSFVVGSW